MHVILGNRKSICIPFGSCRRLASYGNEQMVDQVSNRRQEDEIQTIKSFSSEIFLFPSDEVDAAEHAPV